MAREYVCSVDTGGTGDYTTLAAAVAALQSINYSTANVINWDNQVGSDIADGTAVTWDSGSSSGTLVSMSPTQAVINVTTGTLDNNDTVVDGSSNSIDVDTTSEIVDDVILVFECDASGGAADATKVTIDTDTYFANISSRSQLIVRPAAGNEAGTSWDTSKYRLSVNSTQPFEVTSHMTIDNLQLETARPGDSYQVIGRMAGVGDVAIINNFVRVAVGTGGGIMISFPDSGNVIGDNYILNNICVDELGTSAQSFGIYARSGTTYPAHVYNNTVIRCIQGFRGRNIDTLGTIFKNNLQAACTTGGWYDTTYDATNSQNNASQDALTNIDTTNLVDLTAEALTDIFVDPSNATVDSRDYALLDGSALSALPHDNAEDLSANADWILDDVDIIGTARPSGNWDIGAVEYASEGRAGSSQLIVVAAITAAGSKTTESSAPLSSVGAITAVAQKSTEGPGPLSGVGAISSTGNKAAAGVAPVSSVGAITAAGHKLISSPAPLSSVAQATASGSKTGTGAAPVSGVGAITTTGVKEDPAEKSDSAPLSCVGAITTAATKATSSVAPLGATASINTSGFKSVAAPAPLACVGVVSAPDDAPAKATQGPAPLVATGELTTTAVKIARGPPAPVSGVGSITTTGTKKSTGTAPVSSIGTITTSGFNVENTFTWGSVTVAVLGPDVTVEVLKPNVTIEVLKPSVTIRVL